jgi:acetyl esterase
VSESIATQRPPEPDFATITPEDLIAYRNAENGFRASAIARKLLGEPDAGATMAWQDIALADRTVRVRVYRPTPTGTRDAARHPGLPLVMHVHGGGFVGTAVQCDWTNSRLAAHLPAVVVSVEHRLIAQDSPLSNASADVWNVLQHVVRHADLWHIDPASIAVVGESFGALLCALSTVLAREYGLAIKAQVLINPLADVTETMADYPSMMEYAYSPTRALPLLQFLRQLAAPPETDARACSPLYTDHLGGLPPALIVVPTQDALADHGRRYAERLREARTPVQLSEYRGAKHAFLTLPGVEPQAEAAQAEILAFLRSALAK